MAQALCHGCGAPILWRETPNGKMMPLDAAEVSEVVQGAYVVEGERYCRPAEPMFDVPGQVYHLNHWATCPHAEEFRKGR